MACGIGSCGGHGLSTSAEEGAAAPASGEGSPAADNVGKKTAIAAKTNNRMEEFLSAKCAAFYFSA